MTKQLTPAEELRCYYKAATILAETLAGQRYGDCPDPSQFNPSGKCAHPSPEQCGKCFFNYAINRAMREMEASENERH